MNINEKRKEIDRLDIKISEHIDKRFDVVAEIAKIKAQNDINTEDKSRESEIISNIENSCNHINEITEIYKKIFELSKHLQSNIKSNIVGDDKCFLLGENVTSSFSPVIHAMFGNNNYFLNSVSADSLEIFLKSKQFRGANVTIPYKSTVIKHLDFLSAECALIGSVNTIKNCSGVLFGYNTDLFGMEYMLNRAKIDLKDKEVLILGSGATSKTARFTAQKLKAKSIFFASRNGDINYDNIYEKCNPQVIINTTPVGMIGKCDDILVDIIRFKNLESVADVIYNPLNTRLLQSAKREGLKYTNGLSMLVAQASAANEIFFDEKSNSQKI
ncbi:MAG: chorismate mutase, partial [Clostridia bacterium]